MKSITFTILLLGSLTFAHAQQAHNWRYALPGKWNVTHLIAENEKGERTKTEAKGSEALMYEFEKPSSMVKIYENGSPRAGFFSFHDRNKQALYLLLYSNTDSEYYTYPYEVLEFDAEKNQFLMLIPEKSQGKQKIYYLLQKAS